jgi:hypothetical protein
MFVHLHIDTAFLPASVMLPPRRLKTLLNQAVQLQVERCPFHYVEQSAADYCLLTDHICSRYMYSNTKVLLNAMPKSCERWKGGGVWY